MHMGERLKAERERLRMTIPQFADVAGAAKNTVIDWQNEKSTPPAAKLAALAAAGVDVIYILTGQRAETLATLDPERRALLDNYDACTPLDRSFIRKTAASAAQFHKLTSPKKKPARSA
jgi:transcriptional regulator with XRE-family HTH domain